MRKNRPAYPVLEVLFTRSTVCDVFVTVLWDDITDLVRMEYDRALGGPSFRR